MVTACCVLLVASANIANLLLARGLKNRQQAAVDFPAFAGYTGSLCCAGAPRLPTSGSELSLLILVSMQPSMTTENPPVAYTQFLHRRHCLDPRKKDSAFSTIPPQSATSGTGFSRLTVRFSCYSLLTCSPP